MTWPAYMRIETLARYLDQSVRYVEQLERRGLLPPRRPLLRVWVSGFRPADAINKPVHVARQQVHLGRKGYVVSDPIEHRLPRPGVI